MTHAVGQFPARFEDPKKTKQTINLVLGKGGRGEVEQFVRLVGYEDGVRWGPNLTPRAVYVSSWMAKMG